MRILTISMDRKLFDENSPVSERFMDYSRKVDQMHVVVFNKIKTKKLKVKKAGNLFIYPTNSISRWFYIFDAYRLGKKIIKNNDFRKGTAVISCQDPFETGLVGYLLKAKYKLPLQIQIHTDFFSPYFRNSFLNYLRLLLARFLIFHAEGLRVVNSNIAVSLKNFFPDLKIVPEVLPVFVDIEKISSLAPTRNIKKDFPQFKNIILMASRLSKEKRIDVALQAFKKVCTQLPDTGLIIAGEGDQRNNLENLSRYLGISANVIFAGWQENLISYYKTADLFLLTSEYEGYGMSLVEAGASGCAIVTTRVGIAGSDLFIDGLNSLICPVGEIDCLSKNALELLTNHSKRELFRETMLGNIKNIILSKDQYIAKYIEAIEKLKNKKITRPDWSYMDDVVRFLTKHVGIRYFLSGGMAGVTDIFLLYLLNNILEIHYLFSAIAAFIGAFLVSFTLHKFWTFKSHEEPTHKQVVLYFIASMFGLSLNTLLMYLFVDYFHIQVILSQIIVGLTIAFISFFISRNIVFKYKKEHHRL